ncbi:MAG: hypothetical protein RRA94_02560 [Bacteroidota bacterium]|nr:hypothetical protein [Bacteroidota bacterium]
MTRAQNISPRKQRLAVILALSYFTMSLVVTSHFHAVPGAERPQLGVPGQGAHGQHGVHGEAACHVGWYAASAFVSRPLPAFTAVPPPPTARAVVEASQRHPVPLAHHRTVRGPPVA